MPANSKICRIFQRRSSEPSALDTILPFAIATGKTTRADGVHLFKIESSVRVILFDREGEENCIENRLGVQNTLEPSALDTILPFAVASGKTTRADEVRLFKVESSVSSDFFRPGRGEENCIENRLVVQNTFEPPLPSIQFYLLLSLQVKPLGLTWPSIQF